LHNHPLAGVAILYRLIDLTDRAVVGCLILIILGTPLLFGTVHPWVYHPAESMIFTTLAAALWRLRAKPPVPKGCEAVLSIGMPSMFLVLLILFQLLPLPPSVLHFLSPNTYKFYQHVLNGWPGSVNYPRPESSSRALKNPGGALPQGLATDGAPISSSSEHQSDASLPSPAVGRIPSDAGWYRTRWRSLSFAPPLTTSAALQLFAAFALFITVALYPILPESNASDEDPLTRLLVVVILISGFLVAFVGLVQQATWNGKVLWVFVPLDWGSPKFAQQRLLGPFIDPDHCAAYLAITVPLFLSRAWSALTPKPGSKRQEAVPVLWGCGLIFALCGIMLTGSRAIWAAVVMSCVLFAYFAGRIRRVKPGDEDGWSSRLSLALLAITALSLGLVGTGGRADIQTRLGEAANGGIGFWFRMQIWRQTLRMFRDYPLLGVGFGTWPEVFPHYQSGSWPPMLLRNAHNDYVEAAAELGILGIAALALITWRVIRLARSRWSHLLPRSQLTIAALVAGMGVEAFHEIFDFSLTIPAIGFLFTIYAALIVRIAMARASDTPLEIVRRRLVQRASPYAAAAAGMMAVACTAQASVIYPYYPRTKTFEAARTMVLLHPASAALHLALSSWYGNSPMALSETARAVWIDPRNPFARDLYAYNLFTSGKEKGALNQIAVSVMRAPSVRYHIYLNPQIVKYLAVPDQQAIEHGLLKAIVRGYPQASETLAVYYLQIGRVSDAAAVYQHGAELEEDPRAHLRLLMTAGHTYVSAGDLARARICFDRARALCPDAVEPYSALMTQVFAVRKDVSDAELVLNQALDAGVDPGPVLAAFAQAAQVSGKPDKACQALLKMVAQDPSYDNLLRLGSFYAAAHDYTRASEAFRRATSVQPEDPRAWVELATAEEAAYEYAAADRDYLRASLAVPASSDLKVHYAAFKRKLAASRLKANPGTGDGLKGAGNQ
jgi:O-antigen ligase/tetratricopeptide (TPR) repeat protein